MSENKLKNETSPYLLQHKDNPVNWYPWGNEAFSKAKKENKLIFLSIGYSTCHWCHVMAHESFEDEEVAKILNKNFISIKMDREQYPHIDSYYQKVYHLMNSKGGGWPLTIFLTPDRKVFFAKTYLPKNKGYGSIGLIPLLENIINGSKEEMAKVGEKIDAIMTELKNHKPKKVALDKELELKTIKHYKSYFDYKNKGFSGAPKFPQAANLILLLKIYEIIKDKDSLFMAISSLTRMGKGGIYDQIEGAFYRYSVDSQWKIPHFEKMLYTNAELLDAYITAYRFTKDSLYKKIINETIFEIDKRFMNDGVYFSASNADSPNFEGHNQEGFYFVFDYLDTFTFLKENGIDKKSIKEEMQYFGILEYGNIDGELSNPNILGDKKSKNFDKVYKLLLELRRKKEYPFIDNKINTAWNSLYLKSKFKAGQIDKKYIKEAEISLNNLLKYLYIDNTLYHQTIKGVIPTQKALLEDYSFLISCLFEAYQVTLNEKYLSLFKKLLKESINIFYDKKVGKWRESSDGFNTYAGVEDAGYSSPLSVHLVNLINFSSIEGDTKIYDIAMRSLDNFSEILNSQPSNYPNAILVTLMKKYEPVFIKSTKENLEKIDILDIKYPFVYKVVYKSKDYLACKIDSCFSYGKDFNKIKKDIEALR